MGVPLHEPTPVQPAFPPATPISPVSHGPGPTKPNHPPPGTLILNCLENKCSRSREGESPDYPCQGLTMNQLHGGFKNACWETCELTGSDIDYCIKQVPDDAPDMEKLVVGAASTCLAAMCSATATHRGNDPMTYYPCSVNDANTGMPPPGCWSQDGGCTVNGSALRGCVAGAEYGIVGGLFEGLGEGYAHAAQIACNEPAHKWSAKLCTAQHELPPQVKPQN
jgi:hypothetical protein